MPDEQPPVALVIEDVIEVAEVVQLYLERLGVVSHHAKDAKSALAYLKTHQPAFIILDIGMPVISGWDLLDIMRDDDDIPPVPIAVLTAYTDPDTRNRVQANQIHAFLKKPLIFNQLREVVSTFLKRS
jgi:CheY-like chemotaxis protein